MSIEKKLLGTTPPASGSPDPEGVSFDGTNDYLSRSSDLSGNADGKTFTFSAWVYFTTLGEYIYHINSGTGDEFLVKRSDSGGVLRIAGYSGGTIVLNAEVADVIRDFTWYHILISVDLTSSSNRSIYLNDELQSSTWTTYTNTNIAFTSSNHSVMTERKNSGNTAESIGRAAHVFLDYTYRNLSTESNRRLFIDSDGKPSSTIPSSPILYLPMTDAATAGSNSGTGGDFTVNGVLDAAGRGANQDNCVASQFDGSADYLSRGSANYGSAQKSTGSVLFNASSDSSGQRLFSFDGDDGQINVNPSGGEIDILYKVNPWSGIMMAQIATNLSVNRNYSLQWSFDTSDTGKRHFYLNGVSVLSSTTFSYYDNSTTALYGTWGIGATNTGASKFTGSIGELWFEWDVYRDLSTDNPFWDSDTNRPKPVRQVISETETTPLIAVPMRGDNAGVNLGTDDNFTVRSGPFTGARGGSEFWARSMNTTTTNNYLLKTTTLSGASDTKTVTMAFAFNKANTNYGSYLSKFTDGGTVLHTVTVDGSGTLQIVLKTAIGGNCVETNWLTAGEAAWHIVLFSVDVSDTSKRHVYIDGVEPSTPWDRYADANHGLGGLDRFQLGEGGSSTELKTSFYYLADGYIDFSQESNRNLFVDQLGYPKDLTPAIDAGTIASPLIYMKFDDTSALGTNSGTGGDFTVNGTVTAGADVDPNA
jgi:hypothetical protein